ncbi:MAG: cysteine desulfurase family protein [Planctomycetota bacterium]
MIELPIYFDNHSTTRVDPRVLEAMLPCFSQAYGNAGSAHAFGHEAKAAVDDARARIASAIGATPREIVFTSGATESNNLAIRGIASRHCERGRHIVSVVTEHPSVLDPLEALGREGYEITLLGVTRQPHPRAGIVDVGQVAEALRDDTILVSVMLANNEIGAINPLQEIGAICRERGVPLHSDATQAVGKLEVDVESLQVDLLSFTAHKIYGPKGVGALFVRRKRPAVRLDAMLFGGGQESGLRSGTLNVPGIVGFAKALDLCGEETGAERERLRQLRDRLWQGIRAQIDGVEVNGPSLDAPELRLPGNLNVGFAGVDAGSLLLNLQEVAVSSGSACSSASPEPSHVLRALGLGDDLVRGSIRFGLGRFNTEEEADYVVDRLRDEVGRLRALGSG